ncbi:MAG: GDSL-type esterase/lipase family protein [Bacteroidales bacterium]|nr:GDSL-type esterase/lipase family protein [Bacteroidales bacterium]
MVRPSHTLVFTGAVLASLAAIMLIFPKDGIGLGKDLTLYFPDFQEWWREASMKPDTNNLSTAYIPDLVEEDLDPSSAAERDFFDSLQDTALLAGADIPTVDSSVYGFKPKAINVDNIRQPLELPESGLGCLENLFKCLINPDELVNVVRILHYGDSQIETDRISNYLRYKLQQQFGGSGPGLIPAKTPYDYKSPCQVINEQGTWKRYTIFPKIDTTVKHSRYGVLASFSRFSPIINIPEPKAVADTVSESDSSISAVAVAPAPVVEDADTKDFYHAALKFIPSKVGHSNVGAIKRVKMFYGYNTKPFNVKVMDGESVLYSDKLESHTSGLASKTWNFANTPADFRMEFDGADSPEIYGFAMDGLSGVAVDNIPLRGCSGTIFTKMNGSFLAQMYRELHVKCIILQFGGNAVPSLQPGAVGGFKKSFAAQINYIRRIFPGVSIIVIGPADMSRKVEGSDQMETYPVLPELVSALRSAALSNNCAYWDMYSAMGGINTMPDWVYHEPPYAEKDFVHFTPNGANVMARMFYSALIARYNEYIGGK